MLILKCNLAPFNVITAHLCTQSVNVEGRVRKIAKNAIVFFFNLHNPSSRTLALGLTQSLTEMSTRNSLGGGEKRGRR
jgi:hypothetical protein